jgi:sugar lactone lactonase YvrE
MPISKDVELVLDAHAEIGEGPAWDAARQMLLWVDITRGLVHTFDPSSGRDHALTVSQHVGATAPRASGGLVLAVRDGFAALDTESGDVQMIAEVEADVASNRMNDGKCDGGGRFWAGTMAYDYEEELNAGALYRLNPDLSVSKVVSEVTLSNGLGWSPDDHTMYFIDSGARSVDAFDYDAATGTIQGRRRLVEVPKGALPDGMTVDSEGFLWVALWGAGRIERYTSAGDLDDVIELPVTQVTSCTFGGPDLEDLYITSAAYQLSDEQLKAEPHAGGVFRVRPGVAGLPGHPFGG